VSAIKIYNINKKKKKKRNEQDNYIMIVRKVTLSLYIGNKYTIIGFIGGANWSTRRKPPNSHKSLINFIT
jgi:ABC-type methionine transport system ATPase subunit